MTVSGRLAGLNRAGQDQSPVPPITRVARSSARACRALTTRPSNPCPQLDSVLDDHGGNSAAGDRHVPMEPVMQLRHLRWARSAQLLNAVRSTSGITRTAAARSLRMGSGTATGLIERMRGAHPASIPSRGRPTTTLGAHPEGPLVLAVEIARRQWRLALAGLDGSPQVVAPARPGVGVALPGC